MLVAEEVSGSPPSGEDGNNIGEDAEELLGSGEAQPSGEDGNTSLVAEEGLDSRASPGCPKAQQASQDQPGETSPKDVSFDALSGEGRPPRSYLQAVLCRGTPSVVDVLAVDDSFAEEVLSSKMSSSFPKAPTAVASKDQPGEASPKEDSLDPLSGVATSDGVGWILVDSAYRHANRNIPRLTEETVQEILRTTTAVSVSSTLSRARRVALLLGIVRDVAREASRKVTADRLRIARDRRVTLLLGIVQDTACVEYWKAEQRRRAQRAMEPDLHYWKVHKTGMVSGIASGSVISNKDLSSCPVCTRINRICKYICFRPVSPVTPEMRGSTVVTPEGLRFHWGEPEKKTDGERMVFWHKRGMDYDPASGLIKEMRSSRSDTRQ